MMRDIFATGMGGTFTSRKGDQVLQDGRWSYEGYGNAEIRMEAVGQSVDGGHQYAVRLHSAERAIDSVHCKVTWTEDGREVMQHFDADIVGLDVTIRTMRGDESFEGSISIPDQTFFDGPSPIWLIHAMMTDLPPEDREITAPVAAFDPRTGALVGGFYRFIRSGLTVTAHRLDEEGRQIDQVEIRLADDGCPTSIVADDVITEIVRVPRPAPVDAGGDE